MTVYCGGVAAIYRTSLMGGIFPKTPKERVLGIPAGSDGGPVLPFRSLDDGSLVRVVSVAVGSKRPSGVTIG